MRRLGVVIFGAGKYDFQKEESDERFTKSAEEFLKLWTDRTVIEDHKIEILDRYNSSLSPGDLTYDIIGFLSKGKFDDLVIYYCGHGHVSLAKKSLCLFLRKTRQQSVNTSALTFKDFYFDVRKHFSAEQRTYVVLDACYSGHVFQELMDADAASSLITRYLSESLPLKGTAIFTSSDKGQPSLAKRQDQLTLFTGALVDAVKKGAPQQAHSPKLSWENIRDQIARTTRERFPDEAPTPKIIAIEDPQGDITKIPFFTNRAFSAIQLIKKNIKGPTLEHLYWLTVQSKTDPADFEEFLQQYPDGKHSADAIARVEELIANESVRYVLDQFVQKYPSSARHALALSRLATLEWKYIQGSVIDSSAWPIAQKTKTVREFIARFENVTDVTQAHAKLAALEWKRIQYSSDGSVLEQFIAEFKDTPWAEKAVRRLESIRNSLAKEKALWNKIRRQGSIRQLKRFIRTFPNSQFVSAATRRITQLRALKAASRRDRLHAGYNLFRGGLSSLTRRGVVTLRTLRASRWKTQTATWFVATITRHTNDINQLIHSMKARSVASQPLGLVIRLPLSIKAGAAAVALLVLALVLGPWTVEKVVGEWASHQPAPIEKKEEKRGAINSGRDELDSAALSNRVQAYLKTKDFDRAIEDSDRLLALDPSNAALTWRREAYAAKIGMLDDSRLDQAVPLYDAAIALDPKFGDWISLSAKYGEPFFKSGNDAKKKITPLLPKDQLERRYPRVLDYYSQAIKADPRHARALNARCWWRATHVNMQDQLNDALEDCKKAVELLTKTRPPDENYANYISALDSRGFTYLKMGRYKDALRDFNAVLAAADRVKDRHWDLNEPKAHSFFGRSIAKRKEGIPGAESDVTEAKRLRPYIAEQFKGYGVSP